MIRGALAGAVLVASLALITEQKLLMPGWSEYDEFGHDVSVDGDYLLAGAPFRKVGANDGQGVVLVYKRAADGTWVFHSQLTASDGGADDGFGVAVSINGNYALIGTYAPIDLHPEKVYVFRREPDDTWVEETILAAGDGSSGDGFGLSVLLRGDFAIVGAPNYGPNDRGAAYIFRKEKQDWIEEARLLASDGVSNDQFGWDVAIDETGSYAIAGAPGVYIDTGAAYIFARNEGTWVEEASLKPEDGEWADKFGYSVAMSGDTAAIGAYSHSNDRGAVYVHKRTDAGTWDLEATLMPQVLDPGDFMGFDVALRNNVLVAGAFHEAVGPFGRENGAVYVFFRRPDGVWRLLSRLVASDRENDEHFGTAVDLQLEPHPVIAVGVPEEYLWQLSYRRGAVYMFGAGTAGGTRSFEENK